jgi:hypothetical protein
MRRVWGVTAHPPAGPQTNFHLNSLLSIPTNAQHIYKFTSYQHTRNTNIVLSRLYVQPPKGILHVLSTFYTLYHTKQSREHFNLLILLSCKFDNCNNIVT